MEKDNQEKGTGLVLFGRLHSQLQMLLDSFTTRCDLFEWSLMLTNLPAIYWKCEGNENHFKHACLIVIGRDKLRTTPANAK